MSFSYYCSLSQSPYCEVTRSIHANPGWAIALLVHGWVTHVPSIKFDTKKPFTWPEDRERLGKRNCFTLEHGAGVRAQVQVNCFQDFSRTHIDFSWTLKFTLTLSLLRSTPQFSLLSAIHFITFLLQFNRFPEFPGPAAFSRTDQSWKMPK